MGSAGFTPLPIPNRRTNMNESYLKENEIINKPFLEYSKEQKFDAKKDLSDEELNQMYLELRHDNDEMFENMKEEPITDAEYCAMEAGPYEQIYDPGLAQWSIAKDIEAFYGKKILRRMIKELQECMFGQHGNEDGKVSKELYYEMKCLREGKTPKKSNREKSVNNQQTTKHDNSEEEIKNHFAERDRMFDEIWKDPKRRLNDCYDVQDRQRLKVGEFEPIYDPGFGRMETVGHIGRFYGKDILKRLKKELKGSKEPASYKASIHISPELRQEIKKIYEAKMPSKNKNPIESKNVKSTTKNNNRMKSRANKMNKAASIDPDEKYFIKTPRKLPRNEKYLKMFKGPGTVWERLWSKIIRKGWNDTKGYPLKEKYFDNHFLACSTSISAISKKCGLAKSTVSKYLKIFEEGGVIRIEYLRPKGKKRGQSVFILGEWLMINGKYTEILYKNEAFD